ncbi:MAG: cytochrome P450 [Defluviicoccus sp.]|nr:cytochrome P450 [Defluviicoccus sp.]MDE0274611.1 cytochrome P450 [Defluviicoccus sp.]
MRLKPVAPLHVVEPVTDSEIRGCLILAGTPIVMPGRRIATDEEHFRDGGRLDPERWLLPREHRLVPHDDRAFVPFGAGPRAKASARARGSPSRCPWLRARMPAQRPR